MPSLLLAKKTPHKALGIPEVIVLILSLLSRRELKQSALFVCKLWYILGRPLLRAGHYYWLGKIPLTKHHLLETLGNVQILPIISSTTTCYYIRPSRKGDWFQLQSQVQELRDDEPEECFSELVFAGCLAMNSRTLEPVALLFASLRSVKIENSWMKEIPLETILDCCLALEHLEVDSTFRHTQSALWSQQGDEQKPLKNEIQLAMLSLPDKILTTRLKHFEIRKVAVELRLLERFLHGNNFNSRSPRLFELRIMHVEVLLPLSSTGVQEWMDSVPNYVATTLEDEAQILESIHRSCPSLNSLHFSLRNHQPSQQGQALFFKQFPTISQWSLPSSEILPSTFLSMQAYLNNVTSLDITCSSVDIVPLTLHEYLCTSPHLRHLWTHDMIYPAEYMDLEAVAEDSTGLYSPRDCSDVSSSFSINIAEGRKDVSRRLWLQKRVWACRGLETLQIKIGGLSGDARTARNSRIMFAYLSLVCPRLRDLTITRSMMNVELEGGLCYLAELSDLERLVLQASHFWIKHVSELEWVQRSSTTAAAKLDDGAGSSMRDRNRIGRTLSRTTTRSSFAPRPVLPFKRSKTRTTLEGGKSNLLSRVVGKILGKNRNSRGMFSKRHDRDEITRVRTTGSIVGSCGGKSLDHPVDEDVIIRRLIRMSKSEEVTKYLNKMERRKIRAETMLFNGEEDVDVGYCWPLMEIFACTLTAANFPKLLVPLVHQVITDISEGSLIIPDINDSPSLTTPSSDPVFEAQIRFVRRLREALYKTSALCGGPYGINALGAINYALDPELSTAVNSRGPIRGSANAKTPEEYRQRGKDLFQTIYQKHTEPILTKIGNSSQDLVQSILVDTYGRVLSETSLISIPETELCLVATLVPLDVPPQLKSHVYGSRNVGVPMEQVQQLVSVAESITRWVRSQGNDKSSL
ncbi:hypothetical protein BGX20_000332 [Mortierella sp. AD010]|nr:hypothetical protein BGX20_000332 [Mortierella sp. AD010]